MAKFDKVIKGLECCLQGTYELCKECPYHEFYPNKCKAEREQDALELLKEQEPRVLTLDECATADLVWYDWRTQGVRPAKINRVPSKTGVYRVYVFGDISQWVHADEYGEYWRCWTSRPTDEQREAVKWNGFDRKTLV